MGDKLSAKTHSFSMRGCCHVGSLRHLLLGWLSPASLSLWDQGTTCWGPCGHCLPKPPGRRQAEGTQGLPQEKRHLPNTLKPKHSEEGGRWPLSKWGN